MKIKFLTLLVGSIFLMLTLQSVSGGRAAVGGQDRTGSPGSLGNCTACHMNTGNFTNPQISIVVKDAFGNAVTSYVPGDTYNLEFFVTSNGSPSGYGMQAVVLKSTNLNAGTLLATSTPNTQISTIANGRKFVEHQGKNATGIFKATWQAPTVGTGNLTIYSIGMAVNGFNTTGDNVSSSTQLILTEAVMNAVDDIKLLTPNYTVFPIPNNGNFTIQNNQKEGQLAIQVLNLQGQVVYNDLVFVGQNSTTNIAINDLVQGVYFVKIQGENQVETVQILVAK